MVDPVNSSTLTALSRAQTASIISLKSNQASVQAVIDQLQKPNVVSVKNTQLVTAGKPATNLPRGSLVDISV